MPTDKLIEQRIREKKENMSQQRGLEADDERSSNKASLYSQKKSMKTEGQAHFNFKMRKRDIELCNEFYDMLREYEFEDAQSIVNNMLYNLQEEQDKRYYDDEAGEEDEEEVPDQSDD